MTRNNRRIQRNQEILAKHSHYHVDVSSILLKLCLQHRVDSSPPLGIGLVRVCDGKQLSPRQYLAITPNSQDVIRFRSIGILFQVTIFVNVDNEESAVFRTLELQKYSPNGSPVYATLEERIGYKKRVGLL